MNASLSNLPARAVDLAGEVGNRLRDAVPDRALKWVETGAAIGALRTGTRVAGKFVRRNPAVSVAAVVAGAGLLAYAALRKRRAEQDGPVIEGTSRRVEAKRAAPRKTARKRSTTTRRRASDSAS